MSMLILGIMAALPLVSSDNQTASANHNYVSFGQPVTVSGVVGGFVSMAEAQGPESLGAPGSGWKPDTVVAGEPNNDTVNPSIGNYINPTTKAVTMYVACQYWDKPGHWILHIYRSDNKGASWYYWFWLAWTNPNTRSMVNPSIAVSPYNGTVFVAVQSTAVGDPWNLSNDIGVVRVNPATGSWQFYNVAATADDEINPHLVSEYAFTSGNYLYMSYETGLDASYRSVYFAVSYNWGKTWSKKAIASYAIPTYTQSCITYTQGNIYIAYRVSAPWYTSLGWIDVAYSTDYGGSWKYANNVTGVQRDASWPSIAGAHFGDWHKPTTLIVAYEYNTTSTNHDIYYTYSLNYGTTWTGGSDVYHQIATSANYEEKPTLAVDGMGVENTNIGGNYHLIYEIDTTLYYTQLPYFDIPIYYGGHAFWGYYFGWSTPHGQVTDTNAWVSYNYRTPTITTYIRTVGSDIIWEPGIAWTDLRNPTYDIYFSTPGTDFKITFAPSGQTVVAGKAINYRITVNLLGGTTATAYMGGSPHWPTYMSIYVTMTYNVPSVTPTGTATLTLTTSNLLPPGNYFLTVTATVGGYRRMVSIPYTVVAPPTLTLNVSPTSVARGAKVTISGQLSIAPPSSARIIYLYYRSPHQTGIWKLATTITANAAGAYSITATVPNTLPPGDYDLVAFWVDTATGTYATSPIVFWTVT
jgi:hypothetical protein